MKPIVKFTLGAALAVCTAFLWAGPARPLKSAGLRAQEPSPHSVQRLTAQELTQIDLGTAKAEDWKEPEVLKSKDSKLSVTLTVAYANQEIKGGGVSQKVKLRSYNGGLTGPTLRVKAGDTIALKLKNGLPPELGMEMEMKGGECALPTHGFNVTNLHTHGLHISPSCNSDNVLLAIPPGGSQDYVFKILPAGNPESTPARQYPGTFWYHAHHHGSTAMQLASGMAGALIVEDGPKDLVPEVAAARERLFIFQQFAYKVNDQGVGEVESFEKLRENWNGLNRRTAINGRLKPKFVMRPGEVERWRWIDSGIFTDLPISIKAAPESNGQFKIFRIAADGITLPKPMPAGRVELAPGSRVDLLVQAPPDKGSYLLYKDASTVFALPGTAETAAAETADPQVLAEIVVEGEPCTDQNPCATKIPEKLKPPIDMLPDIEEKPAKKVEVRFSPKGDFFAVNGTCFDPEEIRPEFDKTLGDVEEWTIVNDTPFPHPFHIHVNAFQILKAGKPGEWRDTILVPGHGATVKLRTRFERFTGKFVLHCHILTHEDTGMMALVRVKPKKPEQTCPEEARHGHAAAGAGTTAPPL